MAFGTILKAWRGDEQTRMENWNVLEEIASRQERTG
jgi:hypothetical protein